MFQAALFAIDKLFETEYKPVPIFVSNILLNKCEFNAQAFSLLLIKFIHSHFLENKYIVHYWE